MKPGYNPTHNWAPVLTGGPLTDRLVRCTISHRFEARIIVGHLLESRVDQFGQCALSVVVDALPAPTPRGVLAERGRGDAPAWLAKTFAFLLLLLAAVPRAERGRQLSGLLPGPRADC